MENQSVNDLLFNPMLYHEYPYQYKEDNKDGSVTFIFSKVPKIRPSMIDRAKLSKLDGIISNKTLYERYILGKFRSDVK